jgi:integrase
MGVTIRKKNSRWYVFVNHNGHRKAKCVGSSRSAAEQVKRMLEAKLALGDLGFMSGSDDDVPTFATYSDRWLKEHAALQCKPSTRRNYEQLLRLHITPRFGEKKLTDIHRKTIKEFVSDMSQALRVVDEKTGETVPRFSRNTLRLIVCTLRAVLNAPLEDGLTESNPAVRMGRFAKSAKPRYQAGAMTRTEAEKFLAAVQETSPHWHPFFLTALRSGLRKGELIALKWGDIHFGSDEFDANRYILVQRNWSCGQFTTPKSKKSRRVDLSLQLRRVLMNLRSRLLDASGQDHASIVDKLVFPSKAGTPIKPDNIALRYMQPALEKAGLRKFRFHDLRHSFGSFLIQDGASLAYIRDQLGHSSIQITADVYCHLIPSAHISWV